MFCDWLLPKAMEEEVTWSAAFDAAKKEKGGEPMKFYRSD